MNKDNYPESMPREFKPIRPWGYVGYFWLFALPIIGFIVTIIFATDDSNINRRNLARGFLWNMLLGLIIGVLLAIMLVSVGVMIYNNSSNIASSSAAQMDNLMMQMNR